MSGTTMGGFNGACRDQMSPGLARRIAQEEAEYARETARQERERQAAAEGAFRERAAASIAEAVERGEQFSMREALAAGGVGRTRAEAMEYFSALGDLQDRQEAERLRRAQRQLLEDLDGSVEVPTDLTPEQAARERVALAVTLAQQRGEHVDIGTAFGGGAGRTKAEAIAHMSAQADLDDARQEAAARAKLRRGAELLAEQREAGYDQSVHGRIEALRARREREQEDARIRAIASSAVRVGQPLTEQERRQADAFRARS